jgi:hypothetical protein
MATVEGIVVLVVFSLVGLLDEMGRTAVSVKMKIKMTVWG